VQSSPNAAFTLAAGLERRYADVLERLKKLDPWRFNKFTPGRSASRGLAERAPLRVAAKRWTAP
jgi:hypothetical protein